jgi:hypothetical protein
LIESQITAAFSREKTEKPECTEMNGLNLPPEHEMKDKGDGNNCKSPKESRMKKGHAVLLLALR